mmetsp:Transcript_22933/g.55653  ORF Transcript_22933/g.55653 Transcript_22933/m.55653 type:complete len:221 (-) Transcript_22933:441-1103(-)
MVPVQSAQNAWRTSLRLLPQPAETASLSPARSAILGGGSRTTLVAARPPASSPMAASVTRQKPAATRKGGSCHRPPSADRSRIANATRQSTVQASARIARQIFTQLLAVRARGQHQTASRRAESAISGTASSPRASVTSEAFLATEKEEREPPKRSVRLSIVTMVIRTSPRLKGQHRQEPIVGPGDNASASRRRACSQPAHCCACTAGIGGSTGVRPRSA